MRISLFCLFILLANITVSAQLMSNPSKHTNEIAVTEGHIEILNEEEAIMQVKRRYTILNEHSQANAFHVGYDPDNKILEIDANIYDLAGNKIRKVKKSEIRDVLAIGSGSIYTETRIRYIELSYPKYPYVVEFSYRQKLKGISVAALPNWYFQDSNTTEVEKSIFQLTIPEGLNFQHKMYNSPIEPEIKKGSKSTTYTWAANNIPSFENESFAPPHHRLLPVLRISPERFKIDGYSGSMASWQAYGAFMHDLWKGRETVPAALSTEIQSIIAPAKNNREKIRFLYKFMQENMRYVSVQLGIGGWQPFTATYVNEHGYGDCKALSNYMKAMLHEIGMESYPVIINGGVQAPYEVEEEFVDPDFNHAILYVPSEDMWLECTSSFFPPGYLGSFCNDRKVLLVTPEGGRLARTPKLSTIENVVKEATTITLQSDGSAHISYSGNFAGIPHEKWRNRLNYLTQEELEGTVREKGALPNVEFDSLSIKDDPINPVSSITYAAIAARYASKAGKRLFVPLNVVCPLQFVPEAMEVRHLPIDIPSGQTLQASFTFHIPEGYTVESMPNNTSIATPFGSYKTEISQSGNLVTLQRELQLLDGKHPATDYDSMRSFYQDISKNDHAKMVLVTE